MGLASGQRPGRSVQGEVVEADVDQELKPGSDLLQHPFGDHVLALGEVDVLQEVELLADGARGEVPDVDAAERHRQRLRLQPRSLARPARDLPHVLLQPLPLAVRFRLAVPALQDGDDPFVRRVVGPCPSVPVAVRDVHLAVRAVQDRFLRLLR